MIRTQVYLPKEIYQQIALVAKKEKKAKAQVLRELLEEGIEKKQEKQETLGQAFERIIELGEKFASKNAPSDLSINHDKYLYQEE